MGPVQRNHAADKCRVENTAKKVMDILSVVPSQAHRLFSAVVKRIEKLGMFPEEYALFVKGNDIEKSILRREICVNETHIFRHPEHFELLQKEVLPEVRERKKWVVNIWSAACSYGLEPYSIAMAAAELKGNGPRIKIRATDINGDVIGRAKKGGPYSRYLIERMGGARELAERAVEKGHLIKFGEKYFVSDEIREMVEFSELDLLDGEYPKFCDIVFCRNFLYYVSRENAEMVVEKMHAKMARGGYFFIEPGHAGNFKIAKKHFLCDGQADFSVMRKG